MRDHEGKACETVESVPVIQNIQIATLIFIVRNVFVQIDTWRFVMHTQ